MVKRLFDCAAALIGLACLWPLFVAAAIVIRLDSRGPVFFRQERVGKGFRPFRIYKFRSMVVDAPARGASITAGEDPRITGVGHFLRRTKFDELPQLINVLRGDMSLVGPRPEVPEYVEHYRADYEEILAVRPGITDFASLKFRDEAALLAGSPDPRDMYVRCVLPQKLALAKQYVRDRSFVCDAALIAKTVAAIAGIKTS